MPLLEHDKSTMAHRPDRGLERLGRIGEIHQHEPADNRIEPFIKEGVADVAGDEADVGRAHRGGPRAAAATAEASRLIPTTVPVEPTGWRRAM